MTRRILLALVPLLVGVVGAVTLAIAGVRTEAILTVPLTTAALVFGLLVSVLLVLLVVRARRRALARGRIEDARQQGIAQGSAAEREAHRRFLARLDHELKNPVQAIRATVAAVPGAASDPRLTTVDAQASRLASLVGDLRGLSDLETRPLELEPVDLEQLLHDCVASLAQQHPDAASQVSVQVTRVPWPVPTMRLDLDLVGLAIDNVLANARKFGGGGPVEVRLRESDGWAVVEVADSGRGVPADEAAHVFDELARARNARDVPGSGIGLSLVRTVVQRHGGSVALRSREGEGTVVELRLPPAPPADAPGVGMPSAGVR
ncbi:sensor histidine kinase [Agrococcus jejuensis]|uniref:histidine kinase n=1 Tax=Agrococcus jejuensis TaxID=399736 RepID=A0A1G8EBB6_9MICO|nr:HAMP domain-containing sensor histidine kinase [Agrococcus jejuensis]SDH67225.1 Signal transduction histidine kinase [Agrococcus jejuensis]